MSEAIIFPDAEALLIDLFVDELPGFGYSIPVASRVPNPRPSTFVRVMRAGGVSRDRVIDVPTVAVEAWAPTETAAVTSTCCDEPGSTSCRVVTPLPLVW